MDEQYGGRLSDTAWRLGAVAMLICVNAFFVAVEFALVAVRKSRIAQLVAAGDRAAKLVQLAIEDLDRFIAGTQIGITIASIALGWIGEPALAGLLAPLFAALGDLGTAPLAHVAATVLSFALITILHVVLGELVPKSLALQRPERTSLLLARPMAIAMRLFRPWSGC